MATFFQVVLGVISSLHSQVLSLKVEYGNSFSGQWSVADTTSLVVSSTGGCEIYSNIVCIGLAWRSRATTSSVQTDRNSLNEEALHVLGELRPVVNNLRQAEMT